MLKPKINIAIDGHSSCGKGTLAKYLAKELNYTFIDSGAMYRAVSLYLLRHNIPLDKVKNNPSVLANIQINFRFNESKDFFETYLNNVLVENKIRTQAVANFVGEVSAVKEVRDFLVVLQQYFARNKGVVMDGRDIGTKVLPDAELKIFMTADPLIRARRRFDELMQRNEPVNFEEVMEKIKKRDLLDITRSESPLIQPDDAIILDNTNMSKEEQGRVALSWARSVIAVY